MTENNDSWQSFSDKGSVSGILPFLKEKFEVKDAYGWKSGAKEPWFLRSY